MTNPPSYTVYPYQPSNEGAYNAPLPLITCIYLSDAKAYAERFQDADIVVCLNGQNELIAQRRNNAWTKPL
jgi:hypothetical protein